MRVIQFGIIVWIVGLGSCANQNSNSVSTHTTSTQAPEVILYTQLGNISLALYEDTPIHRKNFLELTQEGFFDSLTFSRVIHNFVVQAGDPRSRHGTWKDTVMGPGYELAAELTEHHVHVRGALAMARRPDDVNPDQRSSGSQFYLVTGKKASKSLLDSMETIASNKRKGRSFLEFDEAVSTGQFEGNYADYLAQHPLDDFRYAPEQRARYLEVGGAPFLDFTYTVFGEVVEGMDIVMRISRQPAQEGGQLLQDIRIDSVRIVTKE